MGSGLDADDYPEIAAVTAKGWEPAPLHECTSERMLIIGRDTYNLSNLSGLAKPQRFYAIYDHMFQLDECDVCGGTCNPTTHLHPAIMDKPPSKTGDGREGTPDIPKGSPIRISRSRGNLSPTHAIGLGDNSNDSPVIENAPPLIEGQVQTEQSTSKGPTLAQKVVEGGAKTTQSSPGQESDASGLSEDESDVDARLAKEAEITKKALAHEKKKAAIRRSNQLVNAKKKQKPGKSFEQRRKEQADALRAKAEEEEAELEAAHQRKLQKMNNPRPARRNTLPES